MVSVAFGPNDGLIYVWDGTQILKQTSLNATTYATIGSVGDNNADAAPIAFSKNADEMIVGNGGGGTGVNAAAHAGKIFAIPAGGGSSSTAIGPGVPFSASFLAAPFASSNTKLFIDQGNSTFTASSVSVFDYLSGANNLVINNIPGASTDMAFHAGRLYAGVGFGPEAGEIRSFSLSALQTALDTLTPLDWTAGQLFNSANNNSGAGMFFDAHGDLFAGGGEGLTVFDPQGNPTFYDNNGYTYLNYDPFFDRVLVTGFGTQQGIYPTAALAVPEPAAWMLAVCGSLGCAAAMRRRRCKRADSRRRVGES
jgi:hypothetical protein